MDTYLSLKNINKFYGNYKASDNVSLDIPKGRLVALLGPSGSGKTTILRMIAGLEEVDSGEIILNGQIINDLDANKREIGFVFQNYALFRYMTIYDNIAYGLTIRKWKKDKINQRVLELIELVGLSGLENRYPNELSGGQRQRVAFARALAPNPELLLLDEPFAAIDAKVRGELRAWLRETINKVGITSIFVTHDQCEAIEVADDIVVLNKGRIEQNGTPMEVYNEPKTAFTVEFMGQPTHINHIQDFKGFEKVPTDCKAVIRPENISIYAINEKVGPSTTLERGVVTDLLFRGKEVEYTVRVHDIDIHGTRPIEFSSLAIGEAVHILIYRVFVYDSNEQVNIFENTNLTTIESVVI